VDELFGLGEASVEGTFEVQDPVISFLVKPQPQEFE
jgi:hypothetical protein